MDAAAKILQRNDERKATVLAGGGQASEGGGLLGPDEGDFDKLSDQVPMGESELASEAGSWYAFVSRNLSPAAGLIWMTAQVRC